MTFLASSSLGLLPSTIRSEALGSRMQQRSLFSLKKPQSTKMTLKASAALKRSTDCLGGDIPRVAALRNFDHFQALLGLPLLVQCDVIHTDTRHM